MFREEGGPLGQKTDKGEGFLPVPGVPGNPRIPLIKGVEGFTMVSRIIDAFELSTTMNNTVKGIILLLAIALQMIKKRARE
jgi:hypothetical protein